MYVIFHPQLVSLVVWLCVCVCACQLPIDTSKLKILQILKEAYRDAIKRKRDKIGMRCSTCSTYDFHIVSVVTFPESTTQSLYCCLVCLSQTLLLCRILSLVHTQLLLSCKLQYIVIVLKISTLVEQAL